MKLDFPSPSSSADPAWIPGRLADARVAVWGIGLMGGSLALALRGKVAALLGIDPDETVCRQAEELAVFDQVSCQPASLLPQANLVLLCAPLGHLPDLLSLLPDLHTGQAVVMDIGSTKTALLPMMEQLPERFAPLGGHPMCGKEVRSLSNACADLYQGAGFALLPLSRTPQAASRLALQLVEAVGAHPVWLDPLLHDRWVAAISHLPYLVANALAYSTPAEAAPLARSGWQSTTRVAHTSTSMMMDILATNRPNILTALHRCQSALADLEQLLRAEEYDALKARLDSGTEQYLSILNQG